MGSPKFSADILEDVSATHDVVCVYTMPDKIRSRGKRVEPTPVKSVASKLGIPVREPNTLKQTDEISYLKKLDVDVICVAAYGKILPKDILQLPKFGCINVHASLLPKWRGAAPIQRAILEGDTQTGVCIMRMEEGLDTGDYCIRRSVSIENKTLSQLEGELSLLGSEALLCALSNMEGGQLSWTKQDDACATYAEKLSKAELDLDPNKSALSNVRKVNASSKAHPARISLDGKPATVTSAALADYDSVHLEIHQPGSVIVRKKQLFVCCEDGIIEIHRIKPANRSEMDVSSFLAGARLGQDVEWGKVD